jgi:hypothetical protein
MRAEGKDFYTQSGSRYRLGTEVDITFKNSMVEEGIWEGKRMTPCTTC